MSDKELLDGLRAWKDLIYVYMVHKLGDPSNLAKLGILTDAVVPGIERQTGNLSMATPLRWLVQMLSQKARGQARVCDHYTILGSGSVSVGTTPAWSPTDAEIEMAIHQAVGVCDVLIRRLCQELEPPDGPAPPNLLYWRGNNYDLPPLQWRMLDYLWNRRGPVQVEDLTEHVWGNKAVADSTVRSALSTLNAQLAEIPSPSPPQYHIRHGHVISD
jgi:hypothetical protein